MVYNFISNNYFTIICQGNRYRFFKSTRGLRQGDPLSASLFIIAQEALSRNIKVQHEMGNFKSFKGSSAFHSITHLMFADDMLLFCNGSVKSIKAIRTLFNCYEKVSGQMVNNSKSSFVCSRYIMGSSKRAIKSWLKVSPINLPIQYMGVPLFKGMAKSIYFSKLVDNITNRINN